MVQEKKDSKKNMPWLFSYRDLKLKKIIFFLDIFKKNGPFLEGKGAENFFRY